MSEEKTETGLEGAEGGFVRGVGTGKGRGELGEVGKRLKETRRDSAKV